MCRARCSLRVKLNLHGGNSVQKKRCPFFFLDGFPVSASTLSASEPPSPSSESSISISWDSADRTDRWESPRLAIPGLVVPNGCVWMLKELLNGELGRGLWPLMPPKSRDVGVLGVDCAEFSPGSGGAERRGVGGCMGARGVVGVVASVE